MANKLLGHIGDKLGGGLADPDRCEARVTDQGELQRKAEAIAGTATGFDQRNVPRPESVKSRQRVAVDRQPERKLVRRP